MKRNFFLFLAITLFSSICFSQENNTTIKGKLLNNFYSQIYLDNVLKDTEITSATISAEDEFEINFFIENTDYYRLRLDDSYYLILILVPGENVYVEYDLNNSYSTTITGSENSSLFYETYNGTDEFTKKIEDYTAQVEIEKKEYFKKIIEENPSSLASLIFIDELDMETYYDTYKILAENLDEYYDSNSFVKQFVDNFNAQANTAIGAKAPEIELENQEGKIVKLSSIKADYILVDFWAAWCKPCRMESPYLVQAYETYNDKGFEIYSISLDKDKADWIAAIEKDNLSEWTHVSDLKFWDCEAAGLYGVQSIPSNFLLDKNGKIVAKDLRGDKLLEKLAELMK